MNIKSLEKKLFNKKERYKLNKKDINELKKDFKNSKILIFGSSGSIGREFAISLLNYDFQKLYLVDKNENDITDLNRDINLIYKKNNIDYMCCDINSFNLNSFIKKNSITHYLNFSALKHVRSQENFFSTRYMFNTNCISPFRLGNIKNLKSLKKIFSISSDKAVNPGNLMGLSKKIMELQLAKIKLKNPKIFVSSTRFANVAFSRGSILELALNRINDEKIMGVPKNIYRYFITKNEAKNLCFRSLLNKNDGYIIIPSSNSIGAAEEIYKIILKILKILKINYKLTTARPKKFLSKNRMIIILQKNKVEGQKKLEEFYSQNEKLFSSENKEVDKVQLNKKIKINFNSIINNCKNMTDFEKIFKIFNIKYLKNKNKLKNLI